MIYQQEMGAGASTPPFLSVVTRCYKRPEFLKANQDSLRIQTMDDYEQILIVDEVGRGIHAANMALANAYPSGEYVLVLDDDDLLIDPEAIATLKRTVKQEQRPGLLFFKADHDELGTLPDPIVWKKRPIHGYVGSCDFISRRDVWEKHITSFGAPEGGDYQYLKSVWRENPCVAWLDRKLAAVQRISKGRPQ